ncbi:hypothetical protein RUA4292_04218 [Ruegeria atlantica]|uniref:Uncharacterized protein n=1 Tax=Ruegeria atlantica TaxID=81569 RepID=A0A0P1EHU6_9RHOB|nr:hypothetical protein RUA4292_04218 [Ruegeria atlantica]
MAALTTPHDNLIRVTTMSDTTQNPESARWHYHPEGPVGLNPLFNWPPRPSAVLKWYSGAWLQITAITLCLALAVTA